MWQGLAEPPAVAEAGEAGFPKLETSNFLPLAPVAAAGRGRQGIQAAASQAKQNCTAMAFSTSCFL